MEKKVLLAEISIVICILMLTATKSFSQCTYNAYNIEPACVGPYSCMGQVLFTASGGTPPYFLNISGGPQVMFNSSYTWTTACYGPQYYSITDALGNCQYLGTVFVNISPIYNAYIIVSSLSGQPIYCPNTFLQLYTSLGSGGYLFQWRLNGVNIPGATAHFISPTVAGVYDCVFTDYPCISSAVSINSITVINAPGYPAVITTNGPTSCTSGPVILDANTGSGLSYQWRLNGTAIAGATSSSYAAMVTGDYDCIVSSANCTTTSNMLSIFIGSPFTASVTAAGPTTFCYGDSVTLNASPTGPEYTYQWRLNGVNIAGATSLSYVASSSGNYDVVMFNGCISTSNVIPVSAINFPSSSITLQPNAVAGEDAMIFSLTAQSNTNYGTHPDMDAMAWTFSSQFGIIRSLIHFDLSTIPTNAIVQQATLTLFNNPTSSNNGGSHSNFSASNASWLQKVTSPWSENTVTWNTQPTTTTVNQMVLPQSTNVHQDYSMDVTALVQDMVNNPASNYGFMLRLQTETTYRALIFASSDCTDSTKRPKLVMTLLTPNFLTASITAGSPTAFCSPGSVILNANTGAGLSYQWRLNGGNISGATSLSFSASASGSYDCIVSNSCGSATSNTIIVTTLTVPATPGSIAGQTGGVCDATVSYSVLPVAYAISYNWFVPTGATIVSGQGTNSVNISFASTFVSGTISVAASNSCGTSSVSSISMTGVPSQPGPITGPTSVCKNQNNVIYSIAPVAGATSYTWTKPPGATFNSGQGTATVNIRFGKKPGNVTVRANNTCGSGPIRSLAIAMPCRMGEELSEEDLDVTLYPNPATEKLNVMCYTLYENTEVKIFNAVGEMVFKSEILPPNGGTKSEIDISSLPDGMYFAEITSGEQRKVLKFIKQK